MRGRAAVGGSWPPALVRFGGRHTPTSSRRCVSAGMGAATPKNGRGRIEGERIPAGTGRGGGLMARFEIPDGWTAQAYQFALDPTPAQVEALGSHAGAARFAYNVMLAAVKANLDQRAAERSYGIVERDLTPTMSWSFQSLRKDWNQRKHTVAVRADGTPWWPENSKEVYASGCRALSEALANWDASRKGVRNGPRMGFPRFKTKAGATKKFTFTTGPIRLEPDRHHITLPGLARSRPTRTPASWPAGSRRVPPGC